MGKKVYLILITLSMGLTAAAANVSTEAGRLASAIGSDTTATSLTITGEIDASDFDFIANKMTALTSLDLSGATIAAYSGSPVLTGKTEYEANTLPDYSLMGTTITSISLPTGITAIGEAALASTSITAITIPNTVTTINQSAFSNCDALKSINIPSSVTTMQAYAFMDCDNLETAVIGNGLTTINSHAFARCHSLSNVTLPDNLLSIEDYAFSACDNLMAINIPTTITTIGDFAFYKSALASIDLSQCEQFNKIGDWAFAHCKALTGANLNNNISHIGNGAFFENSLLANINMPSSTTIINDFTFKGNTAVESTGLIHDGITHIGDFSLMGMSHISAFALPPSVTSIGNNAFEGWTGLSQLNVAYHTEVPTLGQNVWQDVDQPAATLHVSENMFDAFSATAQWQDFNVTIASSSDKTETEINSSEINAFFVGTQLYIKASSEINDIRIFDSSGRQFIGLNPQSNQSTIETSAWDCNIYIASIVLCNGEHATIKLARRR